MKKVTITDGIAAKLRNAVADDAFDLNRVEVFEATFTTSRPLRAGGLFRNGRITRSGLEEMATHLSQKGNAVPIHIEHNLGVGFSQAFLPVGKAFSAEVVKAEDGEHELRGYFFVDKTEHADIVNKIESSSISEMSIQASWKNGISNKSGFNFLQAGNEDYAWDLIDNEGNKLGEDGHHIFISGLDKFYETSLVGRGAAPGAVIHAQDRPFRLAAASAHDAIATMKTLVASEADQVAALKAQITKLEADLEAATDPDQSKLAEKVTKLEADLKAANDKIADLTADAAKVPDLTAKVTALETENGDLKAKAETAEKAVADASTVLREHAEAAAVAAGAPAPDADADITKLTETIKSSASKLHQIIPVNGATRQSRPNNTKASISDAYRIA